MTARVTCTWSIEVTTRIIMVRSLRTINAWIGLKVCLVKPPNRRDDLMVTSLNGAKVGCCVGRSVGIGVG